MNQRHLFRPITCVFGLLLLSVIVPLVPLVTGLPRHRVMEMGLFWLAESLIVFGARPCAFLGEPDWRSTISKFADLGILVVTFICLITLTNLQFTSIQGAGVHLPGVSRPGRLYPVEFGYALIVPILLTLSLRLVVISIPGGQDTAPSRSPMSQFLRISCVVMLAILFAIFGFTLLLFLIDRWFAVASVTVTWLAGFPFVALACERLFWITRDSNRTWRN